MGTALPMWWLDWGAHMGLAGLAALIVAGDDLLSRSSTRCSGRRAHPCGILPDTMPQPPGTSEFVELVRSSIEAPGVEEALSYYAPDGVWDASPWGMGKFEGHSAIRRFFEDWSGSYTRMQWTAEEICDLGGGVVFALILQSAQPVGSSRLVQLRYASVIEWADGLILSNTTYTDIAQARTVAEGLAASRR